MWNKFCTQEQVGEDGYTGDDGEEKRGRQVKKCGHARSLVQQRRAGPDREKKPREAEQTDVWLLWLHGAC